MHMVMLMLLAFATDDVRPEIGVVHILFDNI
jgi:hypothetical protein